MTADSKHILIVTAVSAEKEAVLRGLHGLHANQALDVLAAGVGPAAAAANTAKALAAKKYELVISTGIGGGFWPRAEIGTLVAANQIIAADLGVETAEGFSSFEELGFGLTKIQVDSGLLSRLTAALSETKLKVATGPIITVSTATGTAESAAERARRVPGVVAEAMEGYGVALAAQIYGLPVLEIRAISNQVGPRDKSSWRLKEALEVLEMAFSVDLSF